MRNAVAQHPPAETGAASRHPIVCPFGDASRGLCLASITSMPTAGNVLCGTEDYDACPIFLSKLLRSRRAWG
ncbi:MAG: hypothetical protein Kow0025_14480 [Thermodesulfovibrionales bacterium]